MADIYLGIVHDRDNAIAMAVVDFLDKRVACTSVQMSDMAESLTTRPSIDSEDMGKVLGFVTANISSPGSAKISIELPSSRTQAHAFLRVLTLLGKNGYCNFLVHNGQKEDGRLTFSCSDILLLPSSVPMAYTQFLLGSSFSSKRVAIVATLIARNRDLFYFLTSRGVVHSSQDILHFMRECAQNSYYRMSSVSSGDEIFTLVRRPVTKLSDLERIPLEYAVAVKANGILGQNDALKFALLTVCKQWGIRLNCSSTRDKNSTDEKKDSTRDPIQAFEEGHVIYDPQRTVDSWLA